MPTSRPLAATLDRDAAARYVLSRRTPEGGFCYYRTPAWGVEEPNTPDTLAALESLSLLGVEPPEPAATGRWLISAQDDDGGYPSLTIGWAALRALELLGLSPSHSPSEWLTVWARRLLEAPRPAVRDWRAALDGVLRLAELLDLDAGQRAGLAGLLTASADPQGGWARPGADLETTAVAVQLANRAGTALQHGDGVLGFLRGCEDAVLGMRLRPDAQVTTVGALWAGQELAKALGVLPKHPAAIAASLGLLQRPDGGLGARHGAVSTLRDTWYGLRAARLLAEVDRSQS
ncbi:MAG: prenyltransferase/squalene oxidase repeat-containing protein [Mycolicibacterium sp.]